MQRNYEGGMRVRDFERSRKFFPRELRMVAIAAQDRYSVQAIAKVMGLTVNQVKHILGMYTSVKIRDERQRTYGLKANLLDLAGEPSKKKKIKRPSKPRLKAGTIPFRPAAHA